MTSQNDASISYAYGRAPRIRKNYYLVISTSYEARARFWGALRKLEEEIVLFGERYTKSYILAYA